MSYIQVMIQNHMYTYIHKENIYKAIRGLPNEGKYSPYCPIEHFSNIVQ